MKLPLPIPWYSLEEISSAWDCSGENLIVLEKAGELKITPLEVAGKLRLGITAEERERMERTHLEAPPARGEHPELVKSALWLLGAMATLWSDEEPTYMQHHYSMRDFIFADLEAKGIKPLRSRETDAELIRRAMETFQKSGHYRPKNLRAREAQIARAAETQAQPPAKAATGGD